MDKKICDTYRQWNINHKGLTSFATTWMDLEGAMLSKISQSKKDKYHMIKLVCGIWRTIKSTNRTVTTHRYRARAGGCQQGGGVGALGERGEETKKHKLEAMKQSWKSKYSIGKIINNMVISMCGTTWDAENIKENAI